MREAKRHLDLEAFASRFAEGKSQVPIMAAVISVIDYAREAIDRCEDPNTVQRIIEGMEAILETLPQKPRLLPPLQEEAAPREFRMQVDKALLSVQEELRDSGCLPAQEESTTADSEPYRHRNDIPLVLNQIKGLLTHFGKERRRLSKRRRAAVRNAMLTLLHAESDEDLLQQAQSRLKNCAQKFPDFGTDDPSDPNHYLMIQVGARIQGLSEILPTPEQIPSANISSEQIGFVRRQINRCLLEMGMSQAEIDQESTALRPEQQSTHDHIQELIEILQKVKQNPPRRKRPPKGRKASKRRGEKKQKKENMRRDRIKRRKAREEFHDGWEEES